MSISARPSFARFAALAFQTCGAVLVIAAQGLAQTPDSDARLQPPPRPTSMPTAWVDAPTVPLWPGRPPGSETFAAQAVPPDWPVVFVRNVSEPTLHVFRPARPDGRAVLVVPGGAYQFVSIANEGVDLAERLTELGMTVFVLTYRLPGEGWADRSTVSLQDAQRAMRVIRANGGAYGIDPRYVAVLGFSAGGHLAASLATRHAERVYADADAADRLSARPFAVGLIYPVVTMLQPWTHALTRSLLLGDAPTEGEIERASPELLVDAETPPIYIVHAMDDEAVPVENSLRMMRAMREAGRPVETHLLQEGGHAFGVGYAATTSAQWISLFDTWWKRQML
jgi:acetyl esterase/lipase